MCRGSGEQVTVTSCSRGFRPQVRRVSPFLVSVDHLSAPTEDSPQDAAGWPSTFEQVCGLASKDICQLGERHNASRLGRKRWIGRNKGIGLKLRHREVLSVANRVPAVFQGELPSSAP